MASFVRLPTIAALLDQDPAAVRKMLDRLSYFPLARRRYGGLYDMRVVDLLRKLTGQASGPPTTGADWLSSYEQGEHHG